MGILTPWMQSQPHVENKLDNFRCGPQNSLKENSFPSYSFFFHQTTYDRVWVR